MADNNNLPSTINGDGRKFISLLKGYLNDIKASLEDQINEATKIWNGIADNPDTISEQVSNITIDERSVNGSVSLILKWDSTTIKQYAGVSIDIKVGDFHDTAEQFADKKILQHYDTSKTNIFTIPNVEIGKKYEFTIRGRDIRNALSENARAPITYYYVSEQTHVPEAPYEATIIFDKRGAYWSWKQKPQNAYQWTELRLDEHVGEVHNRLGLTTDWHSTAKPYARVGTGYIYNKGVGNSYSVPATVNYSKDVPAKPTQLVVKPVIDGLNITFASIPEDCTGAIVYVNNEENFVVNNSLNYLCSTGSYTVKVCYIDIFGNGEMSDQITISTIEEIPIEMLNKEKLGINAINQGIAEINTAREDVDKKIDSLKNADNDANAKINSLNSYRTEVDKKIGNINTALTTMDGVIDVKVKDAKDTAESRLTATANAINSTVSDNYNNLSTSITQVANSIELKVKAGVDKLTGQEIVSRINLAPDTVSISGKYIHITGQTVFDDGVIIAKHIGDKAVVGTKIADGAITTDKLVANAITGDKIAANAITSDKIKTGEISADKIATGTITGDKLAANTITGDKIVAGTISGDKIAANSISGDKIQAGSIDTDKMNVDKLSSITANVGDLHGGTITGGTIVGSTIRNETGSFSVSSDGNIIGANITGSRIDASSVYSGGVQLKNTIFINRHVRSGEKIVLPDGYSFDRCLIFITNNSMVATPVYDQGGSYFSPADMDRIHNFNNTYSTYWNNRPNNGDMSNLQGGYWLHGEPLSNPVFFMSGQPDLSMDNMNNGRGNVFQGCGITTEGYFFCFKNNGHKGFYGVADVLIVAFW